MRTQKETDLEDRVAKLESGNYVCPCPDGCNGCEVPDFAIKEIERLKARVDELEAENSRLRGFGLRDTSEVDTTSVDGYCGKRSSKAGLQAGEEESDD